VLISVSRAGLPTKQQQHNNMQPPALPAACVGSKAPPGDNLLSLSTDQQQPDPDLLPVIELCWQSLTACVAQTCAAAQVPQQQQQQQQVVGEALAAQLQSIVNNLAAALEAGLR
jgi:hypothetical protein